MSQEPSVLVIDDDADIREFVQLALEVGGYAAVTSPDGADALRLLDGGLRPRVILLDMRMPTMDGWAFAAAFRDRYDRTIPLVCMTAAPDAEQRAKEIAAEATLGKPFELPALHALLARFHGAAA